MLKKLCLLLTFFLIFCFSASLIGDESTRTYFPGTLGSFWVYQDQDGNELKRTAVEDEEIAGEMYRASIYEPALENWTDFNRYLHLPRYHVGTEWIKFVLKEELETAMKARLTQEMEAFAKFTKNVVENNAPAQLNLTFNVNYDIGVEAADQFNFLAVQAAPDEEWDTTQINVTITITFDVQGLPEALQNNTETATSTLNFAILEIGKHLGTETVETPAGTFEDCLKIEYRTETEVKTSEPIEPGAVPGESVTTLWLAPNVGLVKLHQEAEKIFLSAMANKELEGAAVSEQEWDEITSASVTTYELKRYEIASDTSQDDSSN